MPTVFISYRQLNDAQRQRVRDFATRLRSSGIPVVLDQFYKDDHPGGPPEGWPKWSRDQAISAGQVIVIGNAEWFRCFDGTEKPGTGLGAACEAGNLSQRLYDASGVNEFMRVVYFDRADLTDISFDLKRYDRFHAEDHFAEIVAWLRGPAPAVVAVPGPAAIAWPARCTAFQPNMANRETEFSFFAETLCAGVPQRGTLISADSDHGKTLLVSECYRYGQEALGADACCLVDFNARGTVDNLLDTIASDLGPRLPGLAERSPSRLRETLRRAALPVLFVFDAFNCASEEARDFVQSHFLAEMNRAPAIRLLLAGQPKAMPDPAKANWREHARRFQLGSISDPEPWVHWAGRVFPHLPENSVRTIVACAGSTPGAIASQITTLGTLSPVQLAALGIR